jgi:hypothetical protein
MKISPYNRLSQILVLDPANIAHFSYETDIYLPRVIVSNGNSARVQNFGDHVNITPYEIRSEAVFDRLGIEALMMAHTIVGPTVKNLHDIANEYSKWDIPTQPNAILMSSDEGVLSKQAACRFCRGGYTKLQFWKNIPRGEAYALPDPEFLGVISERTIDANNCWYGIGIINPRSILKIQMI